MGYTFTRRQILTGIAGVAGTAGIAGVTGVVVSRRGEGTPPMVSPTAAVVGAVEAARRHTGSTVTASLNPRPVTLDLGGVSVATWGYAESAPGPLIRAKAGDLVSVDVTNALPADTSVHWHGIALRNDMDGVPGVTQRSIPAGGRIPAAPTSFTGKPGQRVRIRIVNAAADTAFRIALTGHRLSVTHTDGYPVAPADAPALLLGMGERIDVETTLADGVFALVAAAEGKTGQALALVRTGAGTPPPADLRPAELDGQVLFAADLHPTEAVRLADRAPERTHQLTLGGAMMPYRWTINGATFDHSKPLLVDRGQRVRLRIVNDTDMFHPMHLHGHTVAVAGSGARKDTVVVKARQSVTVDFDADNPGRWMTHCHNIYHAEAGMMTILGYRP